MGDVGLCSRKAWKETHQCHSGSYFPVEQGAGRQQSCELGWFVSGMLYVRYPV